MRTSVSALFGTVCIVTAFIAPIESWLNPPTHTVIRVADLTSPTGGADTGFCIGGVNDEWSRGHLLCSTTTGDVASIALWPYAPVAGATPPLTFPVDGAPPWSVALDTIPAPIGHQFDTGNLFAEILDAGGLALLQGSFDKVAQTRYELPVNGAGMVPPNPATTDSGNCDVVITDDVWGFPAGARHMVATSCFCPPAAPFAHVHDAGSGDILHDFSDAAEFMSATRPSQLGRLALDPIDPGTAQVLRNGQWWIDLETAPFIGIGGTGSLVEPDSGLFYFFDADNWEMLIQVLNACGNPDFNNYWVFAAGLTNVEVTLTVTDTQSDVTKTYTNPLGTPFQPITDTSAFATCP